ncbi:anti-sigma factor [Actinomyces naeslundii]|uniref:Anti-sigma factor n=1 Tax=Actinomyces naeslundii TaxID=1655 RepID=A0A854D350_ACTNA|nr:anti-sigma factor [Actinomyces naeslundii]OMG33243.1 anti-sigma factor [Actinomyces naeslundii]
MPESIIPVGSVVRAVGPTGVGVAARDVLGGITVASPALLTGTSLGTARRGCYAEAVGRADRTTPLTAPAPDLRLRPQ